MGSEKIVFLFVPRNVVKFLSTRLHLKSTFCQTKLVLNTAKLVMQPRQENANVSEQEVTRSLLEQDISSQCKENEILYAEEVDVHVQPFSIHQFKIETHQRILKFVLGLHSNNNFTRKDVTKLQSDINEFIIAPLL